MAILSVIGNLKGLFYDGIVIDDVVFKLHYGFTSYLLLFMTFISVGKVFFSEPIYCSLAMYEYEKIVPRDMLNQYCYIHSTFIVPNNDQYLSDSLYKYEGIGPYSVGDKGDVVFHSYYQWIGILLFVQGMYNVHLKYGACKSVQESAGACRSVQESAGAFFAGMLYYVSHLWWAQMENGTMKSLRMNLDNPALDSEVQEKQLTKLVDYFCKFRGRHSLYGIQYLYVVIFNAIHVFVDIAITHFVLNRYFDTFMYLANTVRDKGTIC